MAETRTRTEAPEKGLPVPVNEFTGRPDPGRVKDALYKPEIIRQAGFIETIRRMPLARHEEPKNELDRIPDELVQNPHLKKIIKGA